MTESLSSHHAEASAYAVDPSDYLIMTATDPLIIRRQIEDGIDRAGTAMLFLNNLADNFPDGRRREAMRHLGHLDKPRQDSSHWSEWDKRAHSDLIVHRTYGQFYDDIDAAIDLADSNPDSGFHKSEFKRLSAERHDRSKSLSGDDLEVYSRYILPVYTELRMMGYSHYDLFQ